MVNDTLFVVKKECTIKAIFDNRNLCIDFIVDEFGNDEYLVDTLIEEFEYWCNKTNRYNPKTDGDFEDFFDFKIFEIFMREKLAKNISHFDDCYCFHVEIYQRDETGAFF